MEIKKPGKYNRVQRLRKKCWKMPPDTVYVGRPTIWGNPFEIGLDGDREKVIEMYRDWLEETIMTIPTFLDALKGKNLACWCPLDEPCHADVLLERLKEVSE